MGRLRYDTRTEFDIEDRTLAHLQVVLLDKLRRDESFPVNLGEVHRSVTVWVTPAVGLAFLYDGNRQPQLNQAWLELLATSAGTTHGLEIVPEPPQ